ncbi:MAG: homocysteine S-methyltransferase family protein [Bacteroidota bacterium]
MLPSLSQRLGAPGVLIADGAMGTMLIRRGLRPGDCPERMNLEKASILQEIATAYLEAGAELIQTNTFGASPLKLAAYGLEGHTESINRGAVEAVRRAVADRAYVSASVGPSGRILEPYGDTREEVVYDSYRRQVSALLSAGVDLICVETMMDVREAILAMRAVKSFSTDVPVAASMTFDLTSRGFRTVMGTGIQEAATRLAEAGADVIGSNCGNGIARMAAIAEEFCRVSTLPIIIQSNAGLPVVKDEMTIYPETPAFMADQSRKLRAAGVKIIGGCCGTTPEHISAIAEAVGRNRPA